MKLTGIIHSTEIKGMSIVQEVIRRYKNRQKLKYLSMTNHKKYAFIGIGGHSINNLYPVINYFRLNLKYIVTKSIKNAELIDQNFPNVIGTNDIDRVLSDKEIASVFICTHSSAHFELIKKALRANKNVFVEKPPCTGIEELRELIDAEKKSKGICLIGYQKLYAPIYKQLKRRLKGKCSYNYRFVVGNYPEGDPVLDLFIHPLSLVIFLFGSSSIANISVHRSKSAATIFLQLIHEGQNTGSIELSTDYSWKNATEELIVNDEKNIYKVTDSDELIYIPKAGTISGIPKEKIFGKNNLSFFHEKRNNTIPVIQNNQLFSSGYFSEVENFIKISERREGINNSTLTDSLDVFALIEKIKEQSVY